MHPLLTVGFGLLIVLAVPALIALAFIGDRLIDQWTYGDDNDWTNP